MLTLRGTFGLMRSLFPVLAAALLLLGALHISGTVPLRDLAEKSSGGKMARDMFRAAGRQSLPWRIGQELQVLQMIQDSLVNGNTRSLGRAWGGGRVCMSV